MNLAHALEKSELGAKADRSVHGIDDVAMVGYLDIIRCEKNLFEQNGLH